MEQFDGDFQFAQEQDGVTDFRNDTFVPRRSSPRASRSTSTVRWWNRACCAGRWCGFVLDLPWPVGDEALIWSDEPIGYRGVELAADCDANGPLILWGPRPA